MNAIVLLSSRLPPSPSSGEPAEGAARPANDDARPAAPAMAVPEDLLTISFVGLTPDEAERALASFPGASRCRLADA